MPRCLRSISPLSFDAFRQALWVVEFLEGVDVKRPFQMGLLPAMLASKVRGPH